MLGGTVTFPFHSEKGHLRHRHPSSPETQTSALSWSVTPALGAEAWRAVMSCLPGQDIPPRAASGARRGGCAEKGLGREAADGAANGTSAPSQGWCQPWHRRLPARGGAGRRLHTQQIPPQRGGQAVPVNPGSSSLPPAVPPLHTHAASAVCHRNTFTRAVGLTLSPLNSSVDSAVPKVTAQQDVTLTSQTSALCLLLLLKACSCSIVCYFSHLHRTEEKPGQSEYLAFCFMLAVQESN